MEALAKPKIPSVGRRSRGATTCINTAGNDIEVCYVRKCTENQVKIKFQGKNETLRKKLFRYDSPSYRHHGNLLL